MGATQPEDKQVEGQADMQETAEMVAVAVLGLLVQEELAAAAQSDQLVVLYKAQVVEELVF